MAELQENVKEKVKEKVILSSDDLNILSNFFI